MTNKVALEHPEIPFIDSKSTDSFTPGGLHLLGFRFDGTASYRQGAKLGPDALRLASDNLETFSPYLKDDISNLKIFDLGNLPGTEDWDLSTESFFKLVDGVRLKEDRIRLVTIGGEHSISYAPIKAHLEAYSDLLLLHLDAHADLRDGYRGYHYSHASIIRRVLDHFGPGHELLQYGIRSGTQEEFEWMWEKKTLALSREELLERLNAVPDSRPIYMTLDFDFFDPAYFPGTGTPEAGGEDFHFFIKLLKLLKKKNFIGADLTELAPEWDPTGKSNCLASKATREILLTLKN